MPKIYNKNMPNDAVTINAICTELKSYLHRAKIEKIYQPEQDELSILLKNKGTSYNLIISAHPVFSRIHITDNKKPNPITAPNFCMLLRKHLNNAFIEDISIINADRTVQINIDAHNEIGDKVKYFLIVELISRYSNIILTDNNFKIIDAIRKVHLDQNSNRPILPNIIYTYPLNEKINPTDKQELCTYFKNYPNTDWARIMKNISGISKDTALEVLARDNQQPQKVIELFFNINNSSIYQPCVRYDKENFIKDFYFLPYVTQKGRYKMYKTLNQAADYYYTRKDFDLRKQSQIANLKRLIKRIKKRIDKRTVIHTQNIQKSKNAERYKEYGQLILSYMYKLKKGDSVLVCHSFYSNIDEKIPLDIKKTPNQNAQQYFKKYRKVKRAKEIALQQLKILQQQTTYLQSIESTLFSADNKDEYKEIYAELLALSGQRSRNNQHKKKVRTSKPLHFNIDGFNIYVGKNNQQNEEVTFSIGKSNDLWLHTKSYHGAHTIIKGNNIPLDVLEKAAECTAYYSKGRYGSKIAVDYTRRKNIKRIKKDMKGLVSYSNYKTIIVEPKANSCLRIK